jgi:hypothetical membrane protein
MKPDYPLLAGLLAAVIFGLGITLLPLWIPGYSSVHQTVSEIGMVGSPVQIPFTLMLCVVALCMLIFGSALAGESIRMSHPPWAGYLAACMAISAAGVGVFSFPSPLHNYFGMSELIGYQAPLALAITWRKDVRAQDVVRASVLMSVLMWVAIVLNLTVLDRSSALWAYEHPFYGLVQRSLFAAFLVWSSWVGVLLHLKHSRKYAVRLSAVPTSATDRAR